MKYAMAIHGGAGTILKSEMSPDKQIAYETALHNALNAGEVVLKQGGSALDAVNAAVVLLEECPLFNAGKGSVFNHVGGHEMDAAIMDGRNLAAGAVCGVSSVRNPVKLARSVMEQSGHVMLSGSGAREFAERCGLELMPDDWFYTEQRYKQWQEALLEDTVMLDHSDKKFGTVGAVACDIYGDLAAATSTGGMTNKRFGRIGDSPVIGAGTWADNATCAISCTGHGELFIRSVVAHDIACLMAYKNLSLEQAAYEVVQTKLVAIGGEGGLIAVDAQGNITMPFNSEGMYRASCSSDGARSVLIYKD